MKFDEGQRKGRGFCRAPVLFICPARLFCCVNPPELCVAPCRNDAPLLISLAHIIPLVDIGAVPAAAVCNGENLAGGKALDGVITWSCLRQKQRKTVWKCCPAVWRYCSAASLIRRLRQGHRRKPSHKLLFSCLSKAIPTCWSVQAEAASTVAATAGEKAPAVSAAQRDRIARTFFFVIISF